jgi:hypothetical protein
LTPTASDSRIDGPRRLPIPREARPSAFRSGLDQPLPADRITAALPARPPLQMIVVLTLPTPCPLMIVNAFSTACSQLDPQDQVALLTFSGEVSPLTQFYTDKNRLINEHMLDLLTLRR